MSTDLVYFKTVYFVNINIWFLLPSNDVNLVINKLKNNIIGLFASLKLKYNDKNTKKLYKKRWA